MSNALVVSATGSDNQRFQQMLAELGIAVRAMDTAELAALLGKGLATDLVAGLARRVVRTVFVTGSLIQSAGNHVDDLVKAYSKGTFKASFKAKSDATSQWISDRGQALSDYISLLVDNPSERIPLLVVGVLSALASSGGLDADGGLPDLDIPLMGIGAHRSPFTHSILIGSAAEAIVGLSIRLILATHRHLPAAHDPIFDAFASRSKELLEAVNKGVSIGLAYHLIGDGLAQPAPYHGLPVDMPLEAHQAILTLNGVMEGLSVGRDTGTTRSWAQTSPEEARQIHKAAQAEKLEMPRELNIWLTDQDFDLLNRTGNWLAALSCGELPEQTPAQTRFVRCAWGKEEAKSAHEIAWIRWIWVLLLLTETHPSLSKGRRRLARSRLS